MIPLLVAVAVLCVVAVRHATPHAAASNGTPGFTPSPVAVKPLVAFIGDSYATGTSEGGLGRHSWPQIVSAKLGWVPEVYAVGGSGYTRPGLGSTTFEQRIAQIALPPNLVIVEGSLNDLSKPPATVRAAALKMLTRLRAAYPKAKLVVIGPFYPTDPSPATLAVDDAVKAAAETVTPYWIDPMREDWFPGGNNPMIGKDKIHPTNAGHEHIAVEVERHLRAMHLVS